MSRQGNVFPNGPYKLPDDSSWKKSLDKAKVFKIESRIYKDTFSPMLSIDFKRLGHLGFTLHDYPEEHWEWMLGSLSKQVSELVDAAYALGAEDKQKEIRKALGVRH